MPAWKRIFVGPVEWHLVAIAVIAVSAIAWLSARTAKRAVAAAIRAVLGDTLVESSPLVRGPLRFVGIATFVLVFGVLLFPAFEVVGLQPRTGVHLSTLAAWTFASGLRILLIFILAYALVRTVGLLVKRFEHELNRGTGLDALERAKRARTLGSVVNKGASVLIVAVAVVMVMKELHLDIGPVLTSAGIAGVALGFGAQWLVRDIISGFFLILEDQVRVGDVAAINGVGGLVEELNLRTIVLRDIEGTVHVFPNGAINTLANKSKDFSYYVMDLGVSYREDPDRVTVVLHRIGQELQSDPSFGSFILAPIEVLGIDAFTDWALQLKVRIKTVPLKQWDVGRELRRRIKKTFDAEGIEIPFPERIVTVRDERDLKDVRDAAAGG
ncbi:MAG: mechanosensitive ion channel family protein [Vicinamibacterales bacterium]